VEAKSCLDEWAKRAEENLRLRAAGVPAGRWVGEYIETWQGRPSGSEGLRLGDLVLSVEGAPIAYPNEDWKSVWSNARWNRGRGGNVKLKVLRDGKECDVEESFDHHNFALVRFVPRPLDE
jgi:hypothetical protein